MALVKYMAGVPLKYAEFQSKNIFSHSLKYSYNVHPIQCMQVKK